MSAKKTSTPVLTDRTQALDLISNILESSTEYSIIGNDLDGQILVWNEGARRQYGYEPDEVVGKANVSILRLPEHVASGTDRVAMDTALREGKWEGTVQHRRKNGSLCVARVVVTPRRDSAGKSIGFLLISKDISDEIRLAEPLRATQFYTHSLIEFNLDALMTTDPVGTISDVSPQMETITGRSREELIGTAFKDYFTDPQRAEEGFKQVLRAGHVRHYELTARAKDGKETVLSYNATTFNDRDGRLQGVFAAARDLTERKRFEQTLREKNLELESAGLSKDRFLSSMSHELRTPLNAIIGFTGTMLMKLAGPLTSEQEKQLKTVQASARHLLSLINDLLDITKIESGKVELKLESFSCKALLEEVTATLMPLAAAKSLELNVLLPQDRSDIYSDRRTVSQIFTNLMGNAIKFTEKGRVNVELFQRREDGFLVTELRVSDTGIGIKPEEQAKLFQAFTQLDAGSTRRHPGTGLGLHLSQQLAQLIGGRIELQSEYGKGSVFTLTLRGP